MRPVERDRTKRLRVELILLSDSMNKKQRESTSNSFTDEAPVVVILGSAAVSG
jgi:hypothetical protein